MTWLPRERAAHLRGDRAGRPAAASSASASDSIRLTGGEPTVRAHLPVLVGKLAALPRRPRAHHQRRHPAARWPPTWPTPACGGSTSRSTRCSRERFVELTRRDELDRGARRHRRRPRGRARPGEGQRRRHAGRERRRGRRLRHASAATGASPSASSSACRSTATTRWTRRPGRHARPRSSSSIDAVFPLEPIAAGPRARRALPLPRRARRGRRDPAASPDPFCEQCDRVRLTADGQLRSCLFSLEDHDLRGPAAAGGAATTSCPPPSRRCVGAKWAGHAIGQVQFVPPRRSMSQIGG